MKIHIRGEKITVTDSIKNYIENKLNRLEKYFEKPDEIIIHVNVKVNNLNQTIEVTIPLKKITIRAEESNKDLYAAVDLVIDKIEGQIRKNKTRLKNKLQEHLLDLNLNFEIEHNEENENKIVKRKSIEMKPMDEEEAILQTELLDHDFFIFKNIDEDCISVLYRRKDGKYGIINVE